MNAGDQKLLGRADGRVVIGVEIEMTPSKTVFLNGKAGKIAFFAKRR